MNSPRLAPLIALVAISSCHAAFAQAPANLPFAVKHGLWRVQVTSTSLGDAGSFDFCLGPKAAAGEVEGLGGVGAGRGCVAKWSSSGSSHEASAACEVDGVKATAEMSYRGDFDVAYEHESRIEATLRDGSIRKAEIKSKARWLSECPAAWSDGEVRRVRE